MGIGIRDEVVPALSCWLTLNSFILYFVLKIAAEAGPVVSLVNLQVERILTEAFSVVGRSCAFPFALSWFT